MTIADGAVTLSVRRRIAHHSHFPDFRLDELMAIADLMLREQQHLIRIERADILQSRVSEEEVEG